MTLPPAVREVVETRLSEREERSVRIREASRVGGGCINASARIVTEDGEAYFLKWNEEAPADFFSVEARGLEALAEPGALRIPEVIGWSDPDGGLRSGPFEEPAAALAGDPLYLLLEFVERGREGPKYSGRLGTQLAAHHELTRGPEHGGPDNYIGSLPQSGCERESWAEFWWTERLQPRLERVTERGHLRDTAGDFERLRARLPELLASADDDGMSLLHGDLWSGNVFADTDGEPVLVDPSVYRGHREVDLAMTLLFGGFGADFYRAYEDRWPLLREHERRRDVYQLYPLLVHVDLFGSGYESGVRAALGRVVG